VLVTYMYAVTVTKIIIFILHVLHYEL
jgi:hypothetical protein